MIKAEKSLHKGQINLVDTEINSGLDEHYIRMLSKESAISLVRDLLDILLNKVEER